MRWIRISKEYSVQPDKGSYADWKEQIADEGQHQCIYCAIHDAHFGGLRNFHVEHYRPKSIARFAILENNIHNLFYACPICNTFKGNDWPDDPVSDLSIHCYPNPSEVDYNEIFDMDLDSGVIAGRCLAAKYMVERIYLNRPQLIMERRVRHLLSIEELLRFELSCMLEKLYDQAPPEKLTWFYKQLVDLSNQLHALKNALNRITPYRNIDVERPSEPKKIRDRNGQA